MVPGLAQEGEKGQREVRVGGTDNRIVRKAGRVGLVGFANRGEVERAGERVRKNDAMGGEDPGFGQVYFKAKVIMVKVA